jgi:hypothetical protein
MPSGLASSLVSLTGVTNDAVGEMPRALAILLWSFYRTARISNPAQVGSNGKHTLRWPSLTPKASLNQPYQRESRVRVRVELTGLTPGCQG